MSSANGAVLTELLFRQLECGDAVLGELRQEQGARNPRQIRRRSRGETAELVELHGGRETELELLSQLYGPAGADALEETFERALIVAYTVWNAVVYADVADDPRFLRDIRREVPVEDKPELARLVENLIHRKRSLFGDEWRCIGTWEVRKTAEGLDVRADARDPRATPRRGH